MNHRGFDPVFSFFFSFFTLLVTLPTHLSFLSALALFIPIPFLLLLQHEINFLLYCPCCTPPMFYLASSPPLPITTNFAVLFEQILILPAQLIFPLTVAHLCLLDCVILCSSSVCEAVSFATKMQPHPDLPCLPF